jgi:two-component system, chemotaxis family, chemotaxis protein CheY
LANIVSALKNRFNILLADDSETMRFVLKNQLKKNKILADYDVHMYEAEDGIQAVESYNEVKPHIVFLDIHMPNKDGLEALAEIKDNDSNAYVIMLTSDNTVENVKFALTKGVKGYAIKPLSPTKVDEILTKRIQTLSTRS